MRGTSPTQETLQGAAVLELWSSDGGPPQPGMTLDVLRDWTQEIYRGQGAARVGQDGRPLLRALYYGPYQTRSPRGTNSDERETRVARTL